jgi:Putative nuclear envelope organisation protein
VATKLGETAAYPGDWLYSSWSESDLKAWCDERGIPVPQPSTRDKLIASVRRNSRISSNNLAAYSSAASSSAQAATQSLTDALLDSWSDSKIKEWCDKNGVKVPQGSKRNELIALARKHRAKFMGDNVADSASSYYGAATSKAGNQYAQATDDASLYGNDMQYKVWEYVDWIKGQVGLATNSAYASARSASSSISSSVSSAASRASVSASKAAHKSGPKEAQKAGDAAAESVSKAKHRASEAYQKATDTVKEEL